MRLRWLSIFPFRVLTHFWCNLKDVKCAKAFNSKKSVPSLVCQETAFQRTRDDLPNCLVFNCLARRDSSAMHQSESEPHKQRSFFQSQLIRFFLVFGAEAFKPPRVVPALSVIRI
jgi:hypothetical protein